MTAGVGASELPVVDPSVVPEVGAGDGPGIDATEPGVELPVVSIGSDPDSSSDVGAGVGSHSDESVASDVALLDGAGVDSKAE